MGGLIIKLWVLVMFSLASLAAPCSTLKDCEQKEGNVFMSIKDSFFGKLGSQLIEIPAGSDLAIKEAEHASPSPYPPEVASAIGEAKSWVQVMLKEKFNPMDEVPFLAFPLEEGVFDVVRAVYEVNGYLIQVAQSRHVVSIRIGKSQLVEWEGGQDMAERIAKDFLNEENRIKFETLGQTDGIDAFGKQAVTPSDSEENDWLDNLRWWRKCGDVGFITIKETGEPSMEVITVDEADNREWFDIYKD